MRSYFVIVLSLTCLSAASWASPRAQVKDGNKAAKLGNAADALTHYRRALNQKGDTSVVLYDVGNVLYQQGEYDKAGMAYMGALDPKAGARAQSEDFYNIGNTFFQAQKYDTALRAYIEALRRNPKDDDARYNLELTRRFLQQQQQQPQNQQDKKDQQQQQDQQQKEQQQQQQQQAQQDQQKQQEQQKQQMAQGSPQEMTKQEAERLLNALLQDEQNALKNAKKVKVQSRAKREKDW
jgi:Ca-activated chloride channel homolog